MSRILEALRTAERLRGSTVLSTASGEESKPSDVVVAEPMQGRGASQATPELLPRTGAASRRSQSPALEEPWHLCARPGWNLDPDDNVFSDKPCLALCAEQFRTLRMRLYQFRGIKRIRTLLVTSTVAGEGKTFVSLNLARAIVQQPERRALLIDADMRASRLHVAIGAPFAPGLSDYLRGDSDECSVLQSDAGGNLFFIPAGSPCSNPAELLANQRLSGLLERLAPSFDWVILDAPPILPVSDASILGELCDGVIMVVRAGSTAFDLAQRACQEFKEKNLLGVVLNRADEEAQTYGDYGYGYYGAKREGQGVAAGPAVSLSGATVPGPIR